MSRPFDFQRAGRLLRDVQATFKSRARSQKSISRAEIAGYLAAQLEEESRPSGLDEIWKAIRRTKLPPEQAAKLRTAVADVSERLDEIQESEPPDTPRLELRTNGQLEFVTSGTHPSSRAIPERLVTLLEKHREGWFEDLVLDLVPQGSIRPPHESDHWHTVLELRKNSELARLLESPEYREFAKGAASSVLGQTLITAAALYSSMHLDEPILASATHGDQPTRMWLDDDPFGNALRFVYGSLGLKVKRVVFIDESCLRDNRRSLTDYLSLLRGMGVRQRIAPMPAKIPRDFLVFPGYRIFEYPTDGTTEGRYEYSYQAIRGDSRPKVVAQAVKEWHEMWAMTSDMDDESTPVDVLLSRLDFSKKGSATS